MAAGHSGLVTSTPNRHQPVQKCCAHACLFAHISRKPLFRSSANLYAYYLDPWLGPAVAQLRYALYFRTRAYLHIMAINRRREKACNQSDSQDGSTDLSPWRIPQLTHQWAAPDRGLESHLYEYLVRECHVTAAGWQVDLDLIVFSPGLAHHRTIYFALYINAHIVIIF